MTSPVGVQPAAATLLTGIATDIHQVADCSWTVAMLYTEHHDLHCVCALGDPVDLNVCRESSLAVMASADLGEVALYRFGHPGVPTMVCPVRMDGVTVAVVAIGPKKRTSQYSESDRAFVTHCAKNVGHLLENERMASAVATHVLDMLRTKLELQTARHLQNRLLPNCLTQIPGFDYYGECRPAEDVGGDFFDVVGVDHGARFAVGDITGKGVPAAIMMAGIQATLRGLMGVSGATPLDVMHALNRRVWEISPDNLFATMF